MERLKTAVHAAQTMAEDEKFWSAAVRSVLDRNGLKNALHRLMGTFKLGCRERFGRLRHAG